VSAIAVVMTVGVYGFVALIVKLDDMGLYLVQNAPLGRKGAFNRTLGNGLLSFAPKLMKTLTVVGTIAMFLVGGSILAHGIPMMHHIVEIAVKAAQSLPTIGGALGWFTPILIDAVIGVVAGGVVMSVVAVVSKIMNVFKK
jgi:predicted DNA repair protein MutK